MRTLPELISERNQRRKSLAALARDPGLAEIDERLAALDEMAEREEPSVDQLELRLDLRLRRSTRARATRAARQEREDALARIEGELNKAAAASYDRRQRKDRQEAISRTRDALRSLEATARHGQKVEEETGVVVNDYGLAHAARRLRTALVALDVEPGVDALETSTIIGRAAAVSSWVPPHPDLGPVPDPFDDLSRTVVVAGDGR